MTDVVRVPRLSSRALANLAWPQAPHIRAKIRPLRRSHVVSEAPYPRNHMLEDLGAALRYERICMLLQRLERGECILLQQRITQRSLHTLRCE